MRKSAPDVSAALAVVAALAGAARAHVGAVVVVAKFAAPSDPMITHVDPDDTIVPTPFV